MLFDTGVITVLYRGCEDVPLPDGANVDEDMTIWAQSCDWDLCNLGDGLTEITPGGGGGGGSDDIIVVPGTDGNGASPRPILSSTLLVGLALITANRAVIIT